MALVTKIARMASNTHATSRHSRRIECCDPSEFPQFLSQRPANLEKLVFYTDESWLLELPLHNHRPYIGLVTLADTTPTVPPHDAHLHWEHFELPDYQEAFRYLEQPHGSVMIRDPAKHSTCFWLTLSQTDRTILEIFGDKLPLSGII